MESSLSIPAAEKYFDGLKSAHVEITDWDYPFATIQATIETYRGDFFEDFTRNDAFKVKTMHNLLSFDDNTWELEIVFTTKFSHEIVPLMQEKYA